MSDIKFFEENPGSEQFSDDEDEDSFNKSPSPSQRDISLTNTRDSLLYKRPKLTRGKQKIPISFMRDRVRRCSTFSKRKTGLMKKAFELAELTGAEVLLLVASETNHVYTFSTNRLKPIIESDQGRELIQSCLGPRGQNSRNADISAAAAAAPSPPSPHIQTQDSSPEQHSRFQQDEIDNQHEVAASVTAESHLSQQPQQQTLSIQMADGTLLHLPVNFPNSRLVLPLISSQTIAPDEVIASLLCHRVANGDEIQALRNSEASNNNNSSSM
nr:serum response factor [Hymenolepis microstoma]